MYKRANTPDKQKTNDTNKKVIKAIHKELQERFKGSEYSNVAKGTTTLDEHLSHMLVLKGDSYQGITRKKDMKLPLNQ